MDRKNVCILAGAIVLGFLVLGLTQSSAQRFPGDGRGGEGMVGRYQVVRSSPEIILLLDTVSGELYSAGRDDIRPASARNREGRTFERRPPEDFEKRKIDFEDKGKFFDDKGRFKEKAFDK